MRVHGACAEGAPNRAPPPQTPRTGRARPQGPPPRPHATPLPQAPSRPGLRPSRSPATEAGRASLLGGPAPPGRPVAPWEQAPDLRLGGGGLGEKPACPTAPRLPHAHPPPIFHQYCMAVSVPPTFAPLRPPLPLPAQSPKARIPPVPAHPCPPASEPALPDPRPRGCHLPIPLPTFPPLL
eukprot:359907-Chlamydomonas_euryale.AAC.3